MQKKALVSELRGLRDLGLYEGRITVDHARPAAPHISTKHIERISSLDMSISLDDATNALGRERPATSIDPAKRAVKGITDSDENNRPKEKGINFCVLKVC